MPPRSPHLHTHPNSAQPHDIEEPAFSVLMTLNPPLKIIASMLTKKHTESTEATEARVQRHVNSDNRRCYQLGSISTGERANEGDKGTKSSSSSVSLHFAPQERVGGKKHAARALNNAHFLELVKGLVMTDLDAEFKNTVRFSVQTPNHDRTQATS